MKRELMEDRIVCTADNLNSHEDVISIFPSESHTMVNKHTQLERLQTQACLLLS